MIRFEAEFLSPPGPSRKLREALVCSCGNNQLATGFYHVPKGFPEAVAYICNSCDAQALVNFKKHLVINVVHSLPEEVEKCER